ncbi:MAG TPA: tetratricopeptide repeat protein [Pyrinomonadaceae bacterium]|nr:tetratricopeptide repeat protein [Pyrinomonadaceae bacterium]
MSEETQSFNPYPGPRPFKKEEKDRFFGRETEARELLSLVTAHQALLLYAQSGAGKSSLINAGLVPLLLEEKFTTLQSGSLGGLIPPTLSLAEIPNVYVFSTLVCWADGKVDPRLLLGRSLAEFLRTSAQGTEISSSSPRVIIFDQFEELFTLYLGRWGDREEFFKQIAEVLEKDPLARVVFAMRDDYIAQLDPYCDFFPERLRTRFRLERLDEEAALLAIKEPLEGTDYAFAEGVAETLVNDLLKVRVENDMGGKVEVTEAQGEFVEPIILQVVCQSIWQGLPPGTREITKDHLLSVGEVDKVLSKFYDHAIDAAVEITQDEQQLRTWCEQHLITGTGTRNTVHRGPETTGGIPNRAIEVMESKHLIRAERRPAGRWYELTHDRFIGPIQTSNKAYGSEMQNAYNALLEGDQARQRGDYNTAFKVYSKGLSIYQRFRSRRNEAVTLYWIGQVHLATKDFKEAMRFSEAAADLFLELGDQKTASDTYLNLTYQCLQAENFEEAVKAATRTIELAPENADAYDKRGAAYFYGGHLSEAIEDYSRELQLIPDSSVALNGRGQCLAEAGRYDEALVDLLRAIELAKEAGNPIMVAYASNGAALALGGLGEFERALESVKKALEITPNNAWSYYYRAQIYEWMKEPDKAREDYKLALEKHDPPVNPLRRQRAENYLKQSDVSK